VSRRGEDARARARRQREAVALRSQTARRAEGEPATGGWLSEAHQGQLPTAERPGVAPAVSAPLTPMPPRKPRRRRTELDMARLERLVNEREAAAVAVDVEVRRLRRLGAGWPQLAAALGVSRQAVRQRYGP